MLINAEILARVTPDEICAGIAKALKADDLKAAVGLLHLLATKDPATAEFLLAAMTGKVDAETLAAVLGDES